jgi:hypothetical protein
MDFTMLDVALNGAQKLYLRDFELKWRRGHQDREQAMVSSFRSLIFIFREKPRT